MRYTNITLQGVRPMATTGTILPLTRRYMVTGPTRSFNFNPRTDPAYDVNWSLPNKPPLFIMGRLGY